MFFFWKEFPERGRQGCSRTAPSPSFDRFGPFSHGNCHAGKRPGCTPTPPSQIPGPDVGVHIWQEHPAPPKAMGQMVVPAWCPPEQRLEWHGVPVHPSSHPHKAPARSIPKKKKYFSVIFPTIFTSNGQMVTQQRAPGCFPQLQLQIYRVFFLFLLNTMHPFS